jgi:hypothetical protein
MRVDKWPEPQSILVLRKRKIPPASRDAEGIKIYLELFILILD